MCEFEISAVPLGDGSFPDSIDKDRLAFLSPEQGGVKMAQPGYVVQDIAAGHISMMLAQLTLDTLIKKEGY
jgi:hypothetical protein